MEPRSLGTESRGRKTQRSLRLRWTGDTGLPSRSSSCACELDLTGSIPPDEDVGAELTRITSTHLAPGNQMRAKSGQGRKVASGCDWWLFKMKHFDWFNPVPKAVPSLPRRKNQWKEMARKQFRHQKKKYHKTPAKDIGGGFLPCLSRGNDARPSLFRIRWPHGGPQRWSPFACFHYRRTWVF
jgi:hypothetical protein